MDREIERLNCKWLAGANQRFRSNVIFEKKGNYFFFVDFVYFFLKLYGGTGWPVDGGYPEL